MTRQQAEQQSGKQTFVNIIDGEERASASGDVLDIVNPATGEVYATSPNSGDEDVDAAFSAAATAFESQRWTTPSERQRMLLRFADVVEGSAAELAEVESENTGKPLGLTLSEEVLVLVDQIRFFAGAARVLEGRASGEYLRGYTSSVRREPRGPVAQVTPWNYPAMMAIWKLAPALAAGNTAVLKPSDTTPASSTWLVRKAQEVFPPGVVNLVCGDRDTGARLAAHPVPRMISITGSTRAGIAVATAAAPDLKVAHLELGGKAPVIVFDDADLESAVEGIRAGGFFNAGQDCTAATRVICQSGIYDRFVATLAEAAQGTRTGFDPHDEDLFYGAINNARQLETISGLVDRVADHAQVVTGGRAVGDRGYFYAPTVIADVQQGDEAVVTEIFGPVITVQRFSDEDEAVRLANDTAYGLASSVWTTDAGRAARVPARLDFGCVWVNTHIPLVAEMPHGGFKHSGYGKDLSMYSLEDYTRVKHVMQHHGFEG